MKITRIDLLVELHEQCTYNLSCYSTDYLLETPKQGYEYHYDETKQKLKIIKELLLENETDEEDED